MSASNDPRRRGESKDFATIQSASDFIAAAGSLRPVTDRFVNYDGTAGRQLDGAVPADVTAAEFISSGGGSRAKQARLVNEVITAVKVISSGEDSRAERGYLVDVTPAEERSRRERRRFLNQG